MTREERIYEKILDVIENILDGDNEQAKFILGVDVVKSNCANLFYRNMQQAEQWDNVIDDEGFEENGDNPDNTDGDNPDGDNPNGGGDDNQDEPLFVT